MGTLSKLRQYDEAQQKVQAIKILELGCGERHTAVVLETGNVFVWGCVLTTHYLLTSQRVRFKTFPRCLVLTTYCLLTTHHLLLTTYYCLLPTAYSPLTRWNDKGQLGTQLDGQLGSQGTHTPIMLKAPSELRFTPLSGLCCGPCSTSVWS